MNRRWGTRQARPRAGANLRAVPASDSPPRRGRTLLGRLASIVVVLMLMGGTLVAVSLATAPAKALPDVACAVGGGDAANTGPEQAGLGSAFWLPPQKIPSEHGEGKKPPEFKGTLWETVGTRGLLWSYSPQVPKEDTGGDSFDIDDSESNFENACSPVDASAGYVAQMLFEFSRFPAGFTIGLKELAVGEAPFESFYGRGESLVDVLATNIYSRALVVAVIAAGLWVMTRLRRQDDQRETYSGMIWSSIIVIGISAALVGGNFRTLTEQVDTYASKFNAAALNSIDNVTNRGDPAPTSPCWIMDDNPNDDNKPQWEETGSRQSSCMLYKMLLYNPWSLGQFGTSNPVTVPNLCYDRDSADSMNCDRMSWKDYSENNDMRDGCIYSPYRCKPAHRHPDDNQGDRSNREKGVNLAIQQVIAQAHTASEVRGKSRDHPGDQEYTVYEHLWRQVQFGMADRHRDNYMLWKGSEPTSRMATAVSTFMVNIIMFLAVGLIALLTVFWHGVMFVAWTLLPVVGAVAAFPPARRIAVGYFGIIVQAIFLRMVLGLVLALVLGIMNAINLAESNTGLKIILMIIAAAAMWKLLTSLRSGQLGPTVVGTAGDQGMLPGDRVPERAVGYAQRRWERYRDFRRFRRSAGSATPPSPEPRPARKLPRRKPEPSQTPSPSPSPPPAGGGRRRTDDGPSPEPPSPSGGDDGGSSGRNSGGGRRGDRRNRPPE